VTTIPSGYLRPEDCHLEDLLAVLADGAKEVGAKEVGAKGPGRHLAAVRAEQGVPVYDCADLRDRLAGGVPDQQAVRAELAALLADGPGIVVFAGAFAAAVVDRVSAAFERIIADEKASGRPAGDHFAVPGANDRMWNALEKLAVLDPEAFVDYYANDVLALAATAWLGPGYQVTSQVNVVNPGGKGQTVHRDYHLGFLGPQASAAFPAHVHLLSTVLTLQGAVAHCDMPVQSGPTLYLPHSQKYPHGYLAYWLPEFQEYFVGHHVQLPLAKGDAVFFNPALFHAAGSNHTTDVRRMANLLQISSPFGRAMESVDRARIVEAIYPVLSARKASGASEGLLTTVVSAAAEGYPFPTNLDRDPPVDGTAPLSQADLVRTALAAGTSPAVLRQRLQAHARARVTA
jgi:ectoine hydroxylase-related dioxygenase (phytanoyl-CoA dioxygenase family)